LIAPGFNPCTYNVISWFSSLCFFKFSLHRYTAAGSIIGEDMLYSTMRSTFNARSLTFVSVFELDRADLTEVLAKYPLDKAIIKRRAVRQAFKVEIIAYAHGVEIIKKAKELGVVDKMFVLEVGVCSS
jgi:hypothetical protein